MISISFTACSSDDEKKKNIDPEELPENPSAPDYMEPREAVFVEDRGWPTSLGNGKFTQTVKFGLNQYYPELEKGRNSETYTYTVISEFKDVKEITFDPFYVLYANEINFHVGGVHEWELFDTQTIIIDEANKRNLIIETYRLPYYAEHLQGDVVVTYATEQKIYMETQLTKSKGIEPYYLEYYNHWNYAQSAFEFAQCSVGVAEDEKSEVVTYSFGFIYFLNPHSNYTSSIIWKAK